MEDVGIFYMYVHLVIFPAIWHIFSLFWYIFNCFGLLYQEKSGNPAIPLFNYAICPQVLLVSRRHRQQERQLPLQRRRPQPDLVQGPVAEIRVQTSAQLLRTICQARQGAYPTKSGF
jgi:hypothetical protein